MSPKRKVAKLRPDILVEKDGEFSRTYHTRILLANGLTDAIHKNSNLDDEDEYPELKGRDDGQALARLVVNLRGVEFLIIFNYSVKVIRAQLFDWNEDRIERDTLDALKAIMRLGPDSDEPLVHYAEPEDSDEDGQPVKTKRQRKHHGQRQHPAGSVRAETPDLPPPPESPIEPSGDTGDAEDS